MKTRTRRTTAAIVLGALTASGASAMTPMPEMPAPDGGTRIVVKRPQDIQRAILAAFEAGDHQGALDRIEQFLERQPDSPPMLYNAACALTALDRHDEASRRLLDAVKAGFADFSHMQRDPDLEPLRGHPIFRALIDARTAADGALAERRLRQWQAALDATTYRHEIIADCGLDVLTCYDADEHERMASRIRELVAHLRDGLFAGVMNQRVLLIVPTDSDRIRLLHDEHAHGVYRHGPRELIVTDLDRSLPHELVHVLHHAHMDALGQEHPMWLQEGLGCLHERFEPTGVDGPRHRATERITIARRLGQRDGLVPLADLLEMTDRDFNRNPGPHYAQAAAFVTFLANEDRLADFYAAYVAGYAADPTGTDALERTLDADLDTIAARWHAWLERQPLLVELRGDGA